MSLLAAFEPIWILTAAGYLACRWHLLGDSAAAVLGRFVFHLAMPAALFVTLARTSLAGFGGRPLIAFGASTALVIGAGWYSAGRWFGRKPGERAIWGMAGGYVNSANLGIPIAIQVLGSVSFLVEVVLLQVLVVTPVILTALDRHADSGGRVRLRRIVTLPVRNPVILASALGVACSATGLHAPAVLQTSLTLLASAAVPTALIALGASLCRQRPARPAGEAAVEHSAAAGEHRAAARPGQRGHAAIAVVTALKVIAQPLIAYGIGLLLRLSPPELLAVVVCAGLPTAQNTFIFAQEYGVGEALASRAVVTTTTLSLGSLALASELLGR